MAMNILGLAKKYSLHPLFPSPFCDLQEQEYSRRKII